ncbi:MAG: diguanylate cyclase domain [Polaromonas sp.]|nr:diguanylate cyclase domain [Polaromonas sp.]
MCFCFSGFLARCAAFLAFGGAASLAVVSGHAQSLQPLAVEASAEEQVRPGARVLVDRSGTWTLPEVIRRFDSGQGEPVLTPHAMPPAGGGAVWYRLQFPRLDTPTPMVLALPHPGLDTADFYRPLQGADGGYQWSGQHSGDRRPVASWPIRNLYPAFSLTLGPGEGQAGYLRVTNVNPVDLNWTLWDANAFHDRMKNWYLGLGMGAGLVFLMLVVSCVQAMSLREPLHFFYAAYVAVLTLSQLSLTGLSGEYFWPHSAWWNDRSLSTLALASSALLHLFFRRLLADRHVPAASNWLLLMALAGAILVACSLAPDRAPFMRLFAPYYVLGLLTYLGVAAWFVRQRPYAGLWILAGMACLACGALFPILRLFGVLPTSLVTQYGAQAGASFQIPLLMVGLYLLSREKRASLLRVGAMPTVDPLTGVASHRVLVRRLERLLERQKRDPGEGAAMRIRVSNLPLIRREHGLDVAETAVVQAGALLTGLAREGDTVARHRDGDFVLILHGQLSRAWLTELGQRLIARGLGECPALPPGTMLTLKLAVCDAPAPRPEAAQLMQSLDDLLAQMAQRPGTGLRFVDRGESKEASAA